MSDCIYYMISGRFLYKVTNSGKDVHRYSKAYCKWHLASHLRKADLHGDVISEEQAFLEML